MDIQRAGRAALMLAAIGLITVTPGSAQGGNQVIGQATWKMPAEYKAVQRQTLETHRQLLLSMADSMPEAFYRDNVTPIQRDFVQQIQHAAGSAYLLAAAFAIGERPPALPDTTTAFANRAGLRAYINAAYDSMDRMIDGQTEANRHEMIKFFGTEMPRWQVWDEITTHTVWTAGQIVANFRKHGMAPPAFQFF